MINVYDEAARWARVEERRLPGGLEGAYDADRNIIYLDEGLSTVQRRCVLAHEISHARHCDRGCRCDAYVELRADMDAARMLLSQVEYATAERIYDNEVTLARELGVLPWVVAAYRRCLHDGTV